MCSVEYTCGKATSENTREEEGERRNEPPKKYPLPCKNGSFTLLGPDSVSDSDSHCKPNSFTVICRIQILIPSTGMRFESGSESESRSVNVNSPLTGLRNIPNGIHSLHLSYCVLVVLINLKRKVASGFQNITPHFPIYDSDFSITEIVKNDSIPSLLVKLASPTPELW